MHFWGDEWFQQHGDHLYEAIHYIEDNLRACGIAVAGKEKYGTYRNEYLRFWDGTIYQLFFRGRLYIGPVKRSKYEWINKLKKAFHQWLYWRVDKGYTWKMLLCKDNITSMELIRKRFTGKDGEWKERGVGRFIRKTRLYKNYLERRKDDYNRIFQEACAKWPDVVDELVLDTDGYEMIKPGKWGPIDGEKIHAKYWKPVTKTIEIE